MTRAGSLIKQILREEESAIIEKNITSPDLLAKYAETRKAYHELSKVKDAIDESLYARGSTSGYGKALREMGTKDGETVANRLASKSDAYLLETIQKHFPKTAEKIKDYHITELLRNASKRAAPGHEISAKVLTGAIDALPKEVRDFVINAKSMGKIQAIGAMLEHLNEVPHNFSNTARGLSKQLLNMPGALVNVMSMAMGHNPIMSGALGVLTGYLGHEAPAAIKLAMLKFIGNPGEVNPGAFKNMATFIDHAIKGQKLVEKSTKAIFDSGSKVIPAHLMHDFKRREKLDEKLKAYQQDPSGLMKVGGKTAYYMPDHGGKMAQTATNAVNYLNSLRPGQKQNAPLDKPIEPNKTVMANYHRALDIAQQPLALLGWIKEGTLTSKDLGHLQNLYPELYQKLSQQITNQMIDAVHSGVLIPYKVKMGLSLFLGQHLDSTMSPQSIQAAQPKPPEQQQQQGQGPGHSMKNLGKISGQYMTPDQARASQKMQ
jgi:hypothetical protein